MKKKHFINDEIRANEVKLIGEAGEQYGIVSIDEAIDIAKGKNLDLVLVSSKTEPKVCKIMNYGKFIFEQTKKEKESKRQSKLNEMKEIRLSANIAENDLNHKSKTVRNFIESGHKVKISIRFRGREIVKKDIAMGVMDRFANSLEDIAQVEKKPFMDGKLAIMILAKKK